MACFHPQPAYRKVTGEVVFFARSEKMPKARSIGERSRNYRTSMERGILKEFQIACGQCHGCRLERSREWATRVMHEASLYAFNSFITLTYDEENVPRELIYRHFQLFMKRLRKKFGAVRFYMCGEYGDETGRPHYHACLFGVHFHDRKLYKRLPSGFNLYNSECLSSLWHYGFASIGDVTFDSAAYVARYVMKKRNGKQAEEHYQRFDDLTGEVYSITPEFTRMSLKPGIGAEWLKKYHAEVFPRDHVIMNGVKCPVPKYYDNLYKSVQPEVFEEVQWRRQENALENSGDNVPARLAVREKVAKARSNFKVRTLE